jgi:hypothetical protein
MAEQAATKLPRTKRAELAAMLTLMPHLRPVAAAAPVRGSRIG